MRFELTSPCGHQLAVSTSAFAKAKGLFQAGALPGCATSAYHNCRKAVITEKDTRLFLSLDYSVDLYDYYILSCKVFCNCITERKQLTLNGKYSDYFAFLHTTAHFHDSRSRNR